MKKMMLSLAFFSIGLSLAGCHQTLRENKWTAQDSLYSDYYANPPPVHLDQNYYHSD
jgi:hypothetical protein